MNVSDVWDWEFFWSIFRNMTATVSPFVMIVVAIGAVGMLISIIVMAVRSRRA